MKKYLFALLLLVALAPLAMAQTAEAPLFSATRLSLGGGLNYEWITPTSDNDAAPSPLFDKEFTVGAYAAYNLVPSLDFIGFTKYGLDSKWFNSALGLRVTFYSGGE